MAENITAAVDAGALAVPHGIDAVVIAVPEKMPLLAAPNRRRRKVFVDAGLKMNVVLRQKLPGGPELLVDAAEGRAAISGNETSGVETRRDVALALHHGKAHQGLRAGQINPSGFERILVVESYRIKSHRFLSRAGLLSLYTLKGNQC